MTCDPERVESLAFGELAPAQAHEVTAHVALCPGCARELELLCAESAAFAARRPPPGLPPFNEVFAAARTPRPHHAWRAPARLVAGLGLAAALALVLGGGRHPVDAAGGVCEPDEGQVLASLAPVAPESEESRFRECLVATPALRSDCF
jgi:anti-sigma factor RsiW